MVSFSFVRFSLFRILSFSQNAILFDLKKKNGNAEIKLTWWSLFFSVKRMARAQIKMKTKLTFDGLKNVNVPVNQNNLSHTHAHEFYYLLCLILVHFKSLSQFTTNKILLNFSCLFFWFKLKHQLMRSHSVNKIEINAKTGLFCCCSKLNDNG